METEAVDASPLGKPLDFDFSGKSAKNRFLKAAMTERLSTWDPKDFSKRGIPTKQLINVYRRWGEGEIGLILTGNVMIEYDQLEAAGNPIIPRDAPFEGERFDAFKELAEVSKKHGSLIVAQLSHPGRQVADNIQPNPISASDVQLEGNVMGMRFAKPRPMEEADFEAVIDGFANAAEYTYKAGYDGVQLHGAQYVFNSLNLTKLADKSLAATSWLSSCHKPQTSGPMSMVVLFPTALVSFSRSAKLFELVYPTDLLSLASR